MQKIAVLFGGKSNENEISILTGVFVLNLIDKEKFIPVPVYIHTDGEMYTSAKMNDLNLFKKQDFSSFARIFFRNSINNGLLLIEQPDLHDDIKEGDEVTVVMNEHVDYNGKQYPIASLPENLMSIIQAGGLVKAMRKLNGLD